MKDTFDKQDDIFELFRIDNELNLLLGITDNNDEVLVNDKIRREILNPALLENSMLNFITIRFIDSKSTKNYLTNNGLLEMEIYTSNRYQAREIYKVINNIVKNKYEDMQIIAEGQVSSGVDDIYCYKIRYLPHVSS